MMDFKKPILKIRLSNVMKPGPDRTVEPGPESEDGSVWTIEPF